MNQIFSKSLQNIVRNKTVKFVACKCYWSGHFGLSTGEESHLEKKKETKNSL